MSFDLLLMIYFIPFKKKKIKMRREIEGKNTQNR